LAHSGSRRGLAVKTAQPPGPIQAEARHERPAFFSAGSESLFGVFTQPVGEPVGTAVILVPTGAGTRDSINRNRIWVRLARQVAGLGFHALRFDFHGSGESTGVEERLRLDRPFTEDVEGAVRWAAGEGVSSVILVGSCYGARTALACAPTVPDLRGVVLTTPYVRDMAQGERVATLMAVEWSLGQYVRRLLSRRVLRGLLDRERRGAYVRVAKAKWRQAARRLRRGGRSDGASPTFIDPLVTLLERRTPVLFVFGKEDYAYQAFLRAKEGRLGRLLEKASSLAEVAVLPGKVHAFPTIRGQDEVVERISQWLLRRPMKGTDD
jgi:pimeloyl-ACP methyl ester carboxylesterase